MNMLLLLSVVEVSEKSFLSMPGSKDDTFFFRYNGLHHGSSYLEHLNFLSAVRAKGAQTPAVDLHDGLISVAIGVAAQLSIEKGRFVTIEEVLDEHNSESSY